jgi:ribosomal protein S1
VLSIDPKRVVIDIGGKSEGVVAEKAYDEAKSYIKTLSVGDEIEANVIIPETPDGYTILSLRRSAEAASWKRLEEAQRGKKPIVVEGKMVNPSGVMVDVSQMTGFIPNSQLGKQAAKEKSSLVGERFKVLVVDLDRSSNKIVLSEKEVSEKADLELSRKALAKVKEGEVYSGRITTIYDFGCFVEIKVAVSGKQKVPLEGLVHISELSWDKVRTPFDVVKEGGKVKVEVIGKKDDKLALSIKKTQKDPWDNIQIKYKKDKKLKGKVTRSSDFGVFVSLEAGVEGLIHMTKIPPGQRLKEGDEVNVYVEEVDKDKRKISLGLVLTAKPVGYR